MKKKIWITAGIVLIALVAYLGYGLLTTTAHSPFKETKYSYQGTNITVAYCQPYKKGRLIFGEESDGALLPFGKYWRLGANDPTIITFSTDVVFAGDKVIAGSYRMYAVPGNDSWEVSLNSELDSWGVWEPDYSLDVVNVKITPRVADTEMEQFTINFNSDSTSMYMTFEWDKTIVSIPITM